MAIQNALGVKIEKKEIYNDVFQYILPQGYYFESYGQSYGNIIYGGNELTNFYIVRKYETDTEKNSE